MAAGIIFAALVWYWMRRRRPSDPDHSPSAAWRHLNRKYRVQHERQSSK